VTPGHVAESFVNPLVPTNFEFSSSQASSDAPALSDPKKIRNDLSHFLQQNFHFVCLEDRNQLIFWERNNCKWLWYFRGQITEPEN